jgi:hypothetical protein
LPLYKHSATWDICHYSTIGIVEVTQLKCTCRGDSVWGGIYPKYDIVITVASDTVIYMI